MIFQEPMSSLNPCFTVGFQIGEALKTHLDLKRAERDRRIVELLAEVGIPDPERRARAYPHQLSGGMSQRVMIAMALACRPKLLIADEPTTALDVTIQAQILDLLMRERRDNGMGLVLITHDMGVVAETADRVIVQYAGQQMETNAHARAVRRSPPSLYRGASGGVAGAGERTALPAIPGVVPGPFDRPRGCVFSPRCAFVFDACHDAEPPPAAPALGRARCLTPLVAGIPTRSHCKGRPRERRPRGQGPDAGLLRLARRRSAPTRRSRRSPACPSRSRPGARWRWSANPAPANRRWRGCSP